MKNLFASLALVALCGLAVQPASGQVLLSSGLTYQQDFDTLASVLPVGATTVTWTDNTTLLGWYASRAGTAPGPYTSYRVGGGEGNNGWIWSFGTNGVNAITDRAFGSIGSGTPVVISFGLRLQNDTADPLSDITISYTGEQWRNGGNVNAQPLAFTYQVSGAPIINPTPGDETNWTPFSALTFITPTVGSTASPLDGNAAANRSVFANVVLTGVTLQPGEELFLRWSDINDSGNDHGFGVDDLSVTFAVVVPEPATAAVLALGLVAFGLRRRLTR